MKKVLHIFLSIFSYQLLGVKTVIFNAQPSICELVPLVNSRVFQHACMAPITTASCLLEQVLHENNAAIRKQLLQDTQCAVERLSQLLTSLSQGFQATQFSIKQALQEVITISTIADDSTISCDYYLDYNVLLVGNKTYFQEIFVCLLNNAREAYTHTECKPISVIVQLLNNVVCIHIIDFACGMNVLAQKLALVQGISYKQKGHGLGLSFVRNALTDFKGEIQIISKLGVGTHVCVKIPLNQTYTQTLLQS